MHERECSHGATLVSGAALLCSALLAAAKSRTKGPPSPMAVIAGHRTQPSVDGSLRVPPYTGLVQNEVRSTAQSSGVEDDTPHSLYSVLDS